MEALTTSTIKKEFTYKQFISREVGNFHKPYEYELSFYNQIKDGDLEVLNKYQMPTFEEEGVGVLSKNRVTNIKYHLIITIAMITRICMEGGMDRETAYTLSDLYIQKIDEEQSIDKLKKLHLELITDFTTRMRKIKRGGSVEPSLYIYKVYDYVYEHLQEHISITDIADALALNASYLCTYFKEKTGFTIGQYIESRRIEAAQNMLSQSEIPPTDIGNYLCFANHSYFIKIFKKHTGMTPKKYREKHFLKQFLNQI